MKSYRIFEVNDRGAKIKGIISCRLDEHEKDTFKKLRNLGFNVNRRRNKLIWWDDDYAEIINKNSDTTIGTVEVIYA